jgi:ribosomal protein L31
MNHLKSLSEFINESKIDNITGERHKIEQIEDIKNFIFAGNAIFTIESTKTGKWFTFEINKPKDNDHLFFVGILRGPDNTSSYSYIGIVSDRDGSGFRFIQTAKSKFTKVDEKGNREDSTCVKAFKFFFNNLMKNNVHPEMSFYHMGYCAKCGRALSTPESVSRGIGPVCSSIPDKTKERSEHSFSSNRPKYQDHPSGIGRSKFGGGGHSNYYGK